MENKGIEYEVDKYKIKIENVNVFPDGEFYADVKIDRKEGNGFFLKDLKMEYNSFKEFFNCINNSLFKEYNILFMNEVAENYFNKAYEYCKEIVKSI